MEVTAQSQLNRSCTENLTWSEISGIIVQLQSHGTVTTWKNLENWKNWKNWKNLGFRRPTSNLDVARLKRKELVNFMLTS